MRRLLVALPLLLTACAVPSDLCERVKCPGGTSCDPGDGLCKPTDGGEGGGSSDGGEQDGGVDAGVDAGLLCVPECTGAQKCNGATGTCVSCLSDDDCLCPTPACQGGFCVGVTFDPDAGFTPPLPGESCTDAPVLKFPGCQTTVSFRVDLAPHKDDLVGSCSAQLGGGHDVVYLLSLSETHDVAVTVGPAPGSSAQPVTYVTMTPCGSAPELACRDGLGSTSTVLIKSRPKGTYALVLDSYDSVSGGLLDVKIDLLPPTEPSNETCATALDAPLDGGVLSVDLALAGDDEATSCDRFGTNTRDLVYRVTLGQTSDLVAIARDISGADAGQSPVLALRGAACTQASELSCERSYTGPRGALRSPALAAGTYYLVLEAADRNTAGQTSLSVTAVPPQPAPPNDTCAAARPIAFDPGSNTTSFVVDTLTAHDDEVGSCNDPANFGLGGGEVVYRLTLNSLRRVTITTQDAVDGGLDIDPVLYLRADACDADAGFEVDCQDNYPGTPEVIDTSLPAGDYYLFVESYGQSGAGPTRVTVTLAP